MTASFRLAIYYAFAVRFDRELVLMNNPKGGVVASSTCLDFHSKRLVHIRYRDHVELRNTTHPLHFDVIVWEAVGWIIHEEDNFLVLVSDRIVELIPYEVHFNYLVIIKSDILELREIK